MFKKKHVSAEKLIASFTILDKAANKTEKVKPGHIKAAQKTLTHGLSGAYDDALAIKMYHALRQGFLIDVLAELKYENDDDNLRVNLVQRGTSTKAELKYRESLHLLLLNSSFVTKDIIRFYRLSEMHLNKYQDLTEEKDADISHIFNYNNTVNSHLKDAHDRALACPEDSIMVELAPLALVNRARAAGVVGPELLPFDLLVKELISS